MLNLLLLRKSFRCGRGSRASRPPSLSAGVFASVRHAASRRFFLGRQGHLVTEPLQALDQVAPQTLGIQAVEIIRSEVLVLRLRLQHVILVFDTNSLSSLFPRT